MAISVLAAGDSAPADPVSELETAFVLLLHDQVPSERVWDAGAVELAVHGFGHLRCDGRARPDRATVEALPGSTLGEAGRRLVATVHEAQVAERRAYAAGLVAIAELAALVEARRPFDDGSVSAARVTAGEYLAQVLAFELGISTRAAMDRLGRAWALQRLPLPWPRSRPAGWESAR